MKFFRLVTLLFVLCASASPLSAAVQWTTNYSQALTQAQKEKKPLFLFFTGSDWCMWCKKLESEVLDTPAFASAVGDKIIFVKLDFPMNKGGQDAQNNMLKDKYKIDSFPTVILIDANEKQLLRTGYRAGGPSPYATMLMNAIK